MRIASLENDLSENLLGFEKREDELRELWRADVDRLTAESMSSSNPFKISENDGSAVLKQSHHRIVCDVCLDVHIYGSRFKNLGPNFNDICEKCWPQSTIDEPVLEWKGPCSIKPEKLKDLMPYLRVFVDEL